MLWKKLVENGNPVGYHPDVGTPGTEVADRMRYRYRAKMEYIRSQAKHMIQRAALNRTRRLPSPTIGQMVFFFRDTHKRKLEGSRWQGPGIVVGLQGTNAWVTFGGKCFLVAAEHLRGTAGDEDHYGDPVVQKSLALFQRVPKDVEYEDLTKQADPKEEDDDMAMTGLAEDVFPEDEDTPMVGEGTVPKEVLEVAGKGVGWYKDPKGNPILVTGLSWAYKTPIPRWSGEQFPYRTTWAFQNKQWVKLEDETCWPSLAEPCAGLRGGPAKMQ